MSHLIWLFAMIHVLILLDSKYFTHQGRVNVCCLMEFECGLLWRLNLNDLWWFWMGKCVLKRSLKREFVATNFFELQFDNKTWLRFMYGQTDGIDIVHWNCLLIELTQWMWMMKRIHWHLNWLSLVFDSIWVCHLLFVCLLWFWITHTCIAMIDHTFVEKIRLQL